MFGKRSKSEASLATQPVAPPTSSPEPRIFASPQPASREQKPEAAAISMGQAAANPERKPVERARSEKYYDVKNTVFNALIDTIDLTQLSKLDSRGGARGDSRNCQRNRRPSRTW